MRIILLNDLLPPDSEGGLELSALEIGQGLRGLGHDVQFVCSEWRPSYSGVRADGVHRILKYEPPQTARASKLDSFRAIQRKVNVGGENYESLTKWLKSQGPFDVALVFGILGVGLGVARSFTDQGIPIVWSMGDVSIPVHFGLANQTKLYKLAFGTVGRKWHAVEKTVDFSHVLATSEFVLSELRKAGIKPQVAEVVPRAIDFEVPGDPPKEDPPSLLVACRMTPSRGVDVAIEAAKLLSARNPGLLWKLKIAGGGPEDYVERLKELARPLGARIDFLGKLQRLDLLDHMRKATVVVNPTVEVEGFGRTNIEAMALSAALIATDIPSIHEIIEDGRTGVIVPVGDPKALSEAMERVLTDHAFCDAIAKASKARVLEQYVMPPVLAKIEANLQRAASQILPKAS